MILQTEPGTETFLFHKKVQITKKKLKTKHAFKNIPLQPVSD